MWNAPAVATQDETPPPRALLVAEQLRAAPFELVSPGLFALRTRTSNGVEIIVLRLNPSGFQFRLIRQATGEGEWVEEFGKRQSAHVAFNGGFFSVDKNGQKLPVGLLAQNNIKYSTAWKRSGGYLVFQKGGISILPTAGNPVPNGESVLQSKPTLIDPGGIWAMNSNKPIAKNRTLVCKDKTGDVIVFAVVGGGLSLFEAGWIMRGSDVGGVFDCDSALAMDGGGSTQIWVKDRPDLSFNGETPVQNGVVIVQQ